MSGHAPPPRLAVLDDDPRIVACVTTLLRGVGFRARGFTVADDAIDAIAAGGYDLLLTDLRMPGATGADVCRAVRARLGDAAPPAIAISGSLEDLRGDDRALFAATVAKPFVLDQLLSAITVALAPSRDTGDGSPSSSGVRERVRTSGAPAAAIAQRSNPSR